MTCDGRMTDARLHASPKSVFITGVAGFIGSHVAHALLERGVRVTGVDNLNDYYPADLKRARLARLEERAGFAFDAVDIADADRLASAQGASEADVVLHLAAQAGVRYSIEQPMAYAASNLVGHLSVLELVRQSPKRPLLVYASSSSVYGANTKVPFSESDPVNQPVSLYAATKRADELMSESYARLFSLRQVGLRFFSVYGPWGRPDMAYWSFAERIIAGKPIRVFNHGQLERDFTYIDDVVSGVVAAVMNPMKPVGDVPHRIYNIGNNRPVALLRFIEVLEQAIGKSAIIQSEPMQPGDVLSTCAEITAIAADYGYAPSTSLETGLPVFVSWLTTYLASASSGRHMPP
jgi:UDP-glucuronate 4-epimerase